MINDQNRSGYRVHQIIDVIVLMHIIIYYFVEKITSIFLENDIFQE